MHTVVLDDNEFRILHDEIEELIETHHNMQEDEFASLDEKAKELAFLTKLLNKLSPISR
jgi:hypothetical protein